MDAHDGSLSGRFDEAVSLLDAALVIVTVAAGGERDGCLVGFHCQASIHPRHYAVWLSVVNRTCRLARSADHLGVHVVAADQRHLAEHFGGSTGDEVDKLAQVSWTEGPGGVPLLDDCPVWFVGRVVQRIDVGGDHLAVLLDPVDAARPTSERPTPLRLGDAVDIEPGHRPD